MKKHFFAFTIAILTTSGSLIAQQVSEGKMPNALTKETLLALQSQIGLTYEQSAKAYSILEDFYKADQKANEEMRESGTLTKEETERSRGILSAARDARLIVIFTEEQMKKWKSDPALSGGPPLSN